MKKSLKKLALNRETLRGLETPRLVEVPGGLFQNNGPFSYTIVKEDCCVGVTH
jgi:hypothetical protein